MIRSNAWLLVALFGCHHPTPAPTDFDGLCHYYYVNQPDDPTLQLGVTSGDAWLSKNVPADAIPGFALKPLTADDVVGITRPQRDLNAAVGAAVAGVSTHSLDEHVAFVMLPDQAVVNRDDYAKYDRTFLDGGDCFASEACETMSTWNDIIKNGAFNVQIPYQYEKDYRWVHYPRPDGSDGRAVVSRGWVSTPSFSADGKNGIEQSYNLDVFVDRGDGTVYRIQGQWLELLLTDGGLFTTSFLQNQYIGDLQAVLTDTDAAISAGN